MSYGEVIVNLTIEGKHDGVVELESGRWFLYDGDRLEVTKAVKKLIDKGLAHENDGRLVKGKK